MLQTDLSPPGVVQTEVCSAHLHLQGCWDSNSLVVPIFTPQLSLFTKYLQEF